MNYNIPDIILTLTLYVEKKGSIDSNYCWQSRKIKINKNTSKFCVENISILFHKRFIS